MSKKNETSKSATFPLSQKLRPLLAKLVEERSIYRVSGGCELSPQTIERAIGGVALRESTRGKIHAYLKYELSVFTSNGPQLFMRIPPLVPCFA